MKKKPEKQKDMEALREQLAKAQNVFLTGFEAVQAGEEVVALRDGGLAHLARREAGMAGDMFHKHDLYYGRRDWRNQ